MLQEGVSGPGAAAAPPARPRARRDLALLEVGEEGLLYDRESGMVHILNRTALAAWNLCDGTRDPSGIAESLARAFSGCQPLAVREDVLHILAGFSERGLLERG